jgi:hypothetical protein
MRRMILITLLSIAVSFCFSQNCPTTNIRGKVLTNSNGQSSPSPSAKVDLYYYDGRQPQGQQWKLIMSTYTDAFGLFYFRNINPNNYTIWINQKKSYNIQVIHIDCIHVAFQDLPQFSY